jgi:hypothetical protein
LRTGLFPSLLSPGVDGTPYRLKGFILVTRICVKRFSFTRTTIRGNECSIIANTKKKEEEETKPGAAQLPETVDHVKEAERLWEADEKLRKNQGSKEEAKD